MPEYDYDKKFNYKKGYLREEKIPAFISTKLNQQTKKDGTNDRLDIKNVIGITY